MRFVLLVMRFTLASILAGTALGKALDPSGFADVINTYQVLPLQFSPWVSWAMILIEASLSVWLFVGMRLKQAAIASCGLHLAFLFGRLWRSYGD